jgi:hypothetical protein
MRTDNFVPSELKIRASKEVDVSKDLNQEQLKSIGELIYEEETTEIAPKNSKEPEDQTHQG